MSLYLKKAGIEDIPVLLSLEKSVSGSKLYSPMLTEEEWQEALGKNKTFLAEMDGEVVGEISYEMKTPDHAYINGLVVHPSFQGKGIARNIMKMILGELKNIKNIDLVTHPENFRAINLYKSLGFDIESKIENYFGDGEPRIKMVLHKNFDGN